MASPSSVHPAASDVTSPDVAVEREIRIGRRELFSACVHCGLCLTACPTYLETGLEAESPRGRIHLMRGVEGGVVDVSGDVIRHLDLCLGCRACEPACPSGVRYGELIEGARSYVEKLHRRTWRDRLWRRVLAAILPEPRRLRVLLGPYRLLQRLGLWRFAQRWIRVARLLPDEPVPPRLSGSFPALAPEKARVGLFSGCVTGELFGNLHRASVRMLTRAGFSVEVLDAGCCGALDLHAGNEELARRRARRVVRSVGAHLSAVVVNAAGCGALMKDYGRLLCDDPEYADAAASVAKKVVDVTEILAGAESFTGTAFSLPLRVTYHDACHLAHAQGIREAPRRLLRGIPGLELVELEESDVCCGSAGSYNLTEPEMAERLSNRKAERILATGATCVATANPGCALQLRAGLAARGASIRVVHPVELLDEAFGGGPDVRQ